MLVEALRGSGGDERTGHLIYNKAHCNLLLTTSYYPSGWCVYNSGLALTFLSRKLNALWIREDILFVNLLFSLLRTEAIEVLHSFFSSPSKETN